MQEGKGSARRGSVESRAKGSDSDSCWWLIVGLSPSWPRLSRPSTKSQPQSQKRIGNGERNLLRICFPSLSRLALRGFAWIAGTSPAMTIEAPRRGRNEVVQ